MKQLPENPFDFQARVMSALIDDIADPKATSFPRLDALRAVSNSHERDGGREPINARRQIGDDDE